MKPDLDEFEILTPVGEQRFGILPLVLVKKLDFNIVDFANFYSSVTVIDLPYGFVSFLDALASLDLMLSVSQ